MTISEAELAEMREAVREVHDFRQQLKLHRETVNELGTQLEAVARAALAANELLLDLDRKHETLSKRVTILLTTIARRVDIDNADSWKN